MHVLAHMLIDSETDSAAMRCLVRVPASALGDALDGEERGKNRPAVAAAIRARIEQHANETKGE